MEDIFCVIANDQAVFVDISDGSSCTQRYQCFSR